MRLARAIVVLSILVLVSGAPAKGEIAKGNTAKPGGSTSEMIADFVAHSEVFIPMGHRSGRSDEPVWFPRPRASGWSADVEAVRPPGRPAHQHGRNREYR